LETLKDDPPGQALRRLIGRVKLLPQPCTGEVGLHLFGVQGRFVLLRKLAVESVWLAHDGRPVDSSLLLELGALTTNRLIALAEALGGGSFDRRSFFALMGSQVEGHREMDRTWRERTRGVQSLIAAQAKIDFLERSLPLGTAEREIGEARRCAADCAVYIAFFLEAWQRRDEQVRDVRSPR
jgi:hypothetical protein